jgi:6-phosphogluconate dehydrogenase
VKIAISGLGRMGGQVARKLSEDGHEVIANNRSPEPIERAISYGAVGAYSKREALKAFNGAQAVVWIMLPSQILDAQIDEWLGLLPKDSVLVDGGNSDFRLTKQRAAKIKAAGSTLIDVGTSGGVWGYENGFSMMAGGDQTAFKLVEPALKTLGKPRGAYQYFGESGSGHFVKMVHNAIEYGMMESLAEGYLILKDGPFKDLNLAAAGEVWQHSSVVTSWLNGLAAEALKENPQLVGIEGVVSETGEARWTLEVAKEMNIPMPSIQASFDVRISSQKGDINFATKLLAAMRNKFGGHEVNPQN